MRGLRRERGGPIAWLLKQIDNENDDDNDNDLRVGKMIILLLAAVAFVIVIVLVLVIGLIIAGSKYVGPQEGTRRPNRLAPQTNR